MQKAAKHILALKKKIKKKSRFTLLPFYVEIQVDEKWAGEEEIVWGRLFVHGDNNSAERISPILFSPLKAAQECINSMPVSKFAQ